MKKNKKWVSIVEAIVSMVIIVIWIIWTYEIYFSTLFLSESSKNRITAIEIAREWIEAVTNIRDTNWIKFSADYKNCWNVKDYDSSCLNNNLTTTDIKSWSYIVWRDDFDRWNLTKRTTWWSDNYGDITYNNNYIINVDANWFYTQSWWVIMTWALFTREVIINYLDTWSWAWNSNNEKMTIDSLVIWQDRASKDPHKIRLSTMISWWKK